MDLAHLKATAQAMVAPGKGIIAIDESSGTCQKRFDSIGRECTEENRREYRELLITAPGIEDHVGGMILFDETLRQSTADGRSFVSVFEERGILPGIKVDRGRKPMALHPGEEITEGLDGLRERLEEYRSLGARFTKWRSAYYIGEGIPSPALYKAHGHDLARYAALCQEAGLVPMAEPEILLDGDHSIERCYEVTAQALQVLFAELAEQGVALEGMILKVSMVLSGKDASSRADAQTVADWTVKCLKENVPANLAGIVFLSGGQGPQEATQHLNLMNKNHADLPWPLSFSYSRAIQEPVLKHWGENREDVAGAQAKLLHRVKMNGLATQGQYSPDQD